MAKVPVNSTVPPLRQSLNISYDGLGPVCKPSKIRSKGEFNINLYNSTEPICWCWNSSQRPRCDVNHVLRPTAPVLDNGGQGVQGQPSHCSKITI